MDAASVACEIISSPPPDKDTAAGDSKEPRERHQKTRWPDEDNHAHLKARLIGAEKDLFCSGNKPRAQACAMQL
jgi:hypothetical protein